MMKTRSFLLSTLAVFIFAGCSSEDAREGNIPSGELNGKAYLSLSLQSHTSTTRAANVVEKPGSSGESKAGTVRVLLFDEINRSSDKFPKNCEIIIPKKIPLTWNFEHNKPIGFAIPFKDNNGIYATAETFSNEYINVKDIRDILTDGKIGVGGYYKLGETHYEGKLLIIDEATLVEIGLTLAPVRDEYYFKIMEG